MQRLGPYRIIRTIALGGMGEVFLAALERSGGFEKRVALKCVLPRLMADPRFVELFEREARLAAALTHRHIVQIFDFGRDQGRSWLAMEYVNGVDLKAVLDGLDGPLPPGLAVEIGVACARGLDYAHRARDARGRPLHLVHRDVSPQNVLLSFEGDVKLADFGLAHAAARDPHEGGLQGKFAYMSPEQVEGVPLDGRSDQFALGAVLYEMVSGRRAFFGDDGVEAILDRVRGAAPRAPLAEAAPELPDAVRAVIERAMQADRTERFPDAGALADALIAAAATAGIRPGEPALGRWLRARFPDRGRLVAPEPAESTAAAGLPISGEPAEITAVAGQPIAPPVEVTVDAAAPAGLRIDPLAATPSDVPAVGGPPAAAGVAEAAGAAPEAPVSTAAPSRRGWLLAGLALAIGLGAWALFGRGDRIEPPARGAVEAGATSAITAPEGAGLAIDPGPDAAARDAAPADAAPADAARADASPPDAAPPDAALADAAPVDASPAAARRPAPVRPTAITARTLRPRPGEAPRPPIPDAAPPPIPDAAPPPPIPDAAPRPADPEPPAGPRVRIFTPGARVADGSSGDWRPVPDAGLLVRVVDAPGPPVVLRIRARGGRFEAAVDARPWGRVLLGELDLGVTPAAAVPLEPGRQTLRVVGPAGGETVVRIEAARD